jgi:hypothetical protein
MTKKILGLGVVLFSLASAIPTSAQEIATLALRDGQRPSGELIDMNGSGFILRWTAKSVRSHRTTSRRWNS